jgi:stress response protein SCP2
MAATVPLRKKGTMRLPGQIFEAGLGWDPAESASEQVDLDLWFIRRNNGVYEAISWANFAWERPDLGTTADKNPYIATPELDVIHKGDDRTGASSAGGYDENGTIDLSKSPGGVDQYSVFAGYYDDPEAPNYPTGYTLGMVTNVKVGVKDVASGNTVEVPVLEKHGFHVSILVCTIDRQPDGSWNITSKESDNPDDNGWPEDMVTVASKLGCKLG